MSRLSNTDASQTVSSPITPYCELPMEVVVVNESSQKQDSDSLDDAACSLTKAHDAWSFESGSQRRSQSLVLRFETDGSSVFEQLSRFDVLRMTQAAATTPPDDRARSTEQPRSFRGDAPQAKKSGVRRVHSRDIRKLGDAFAVSNEPFIKLRNQAVLINADPVRAVIVRHCCLVFVPDGADSLVLTLQEMFREATSEDGLELPFEFKALEALLSTLCRYFASTYTRSAPVIFAALDKLASGKISVRELEALREYKNTMQEFESQVGGARRALMEILDDEEDMRLLYLTKLHEDPSLLQDLWSFDSEEAEVLIENYLLDIYSTRTKASLLQHRIQNTESLVMLKLDSKRNYLLGVNIIFSVLAIALAVGTFVTGVFGMNLNSNLQNTEGMFWSVTGVSVAMTIVSPIAGWLFFRR